MTDYTVTPADVNDAHKRERAAWDARDDAGYTLRVFQRKAQSGSDVDQDESVRATEQERAATSEWHNAYIAMQDALRTALTERGFDMAVVIRIAKGM